MIEIQQEPGAALGTPSAQPLSDYQAQISKELEAATAPRSAFDPTHEEQGMLDEIGNRESGGVYNLLHGPGGQTISDLSQFPKWEGFQGPEGTSHAAGKYGFEPGTYHEMAAQTGRSDFSPESQDINALQLLRTYGPNHAHSWEASGPYRPQDIKLAANTVNQGLTFSDASGGRQEDYGALLRHESQADTKVLPPGVPSHAVDGSADAYKALLGQAQRQAAPITDYGVPPAPGTLETLSHAASYIPAMAWRTIAASLGWRSDALNLATKGFEWAQHKMGLNPTPAPPLGGENPPGPATPGQAALNVLQRPNTQNFASLGGTAKPPPLPSEVGDPSRAAHYLETLGLPAMAVAGAGAPSTISGLLGGTMNVGGALGRTLLHGAEGAGIYGTAELLAQDIGGYEGGSPAAQAGGIAAAAALMGVKGAWAAGVANGISKLNESTPGWWQKYVAGKVGPEASIRSNLEGAELGAGTPEAQAGRIEAAQNVAAATNPEWQNMVAGGPQFVPGLKIPAATLSEDPGAQALMQLHAHHDRLAQGQFEKILEGNQAAIGAAEKNIVAGPGVAADTMNYFQKSLDDDQQAMVDRVNDAGDEALRNYHAAIRDAAAPSDSLLARETIGRETGTALAGAENDLKAFTDARWARARDLGVMEVPIANPQSTVLNRIQTLAAQAIKSGQGDRFPFASVRSLFGKDLSKSFDAEGNYIGGYPIPANMTIGDIREVSSNLEADIRQERRAVTSPFAQGDPKALRWMTQVARTLNDSIDTNLANGPSNLMAYRQATAATKNYYDLMHSGTVGRLLGVDLQGQEKVPPAQTMDKLVPGGLAGADATRQLFQLIQQREAMRPEAQLLGTPLGHPADKLPGLIQNYLRQDFADAMNQGGWEHGQRWMGNHAVALEGFPQLKSEAESAVGSQQAHAMLQEGMTDFDRQQGERAASLFLNGNAGREIDYVTRSKNPGRAMNGLLDAAAGDTTGAASQGVARMFFDRMRAEGINADGSYKPGAVTSFWRDHQDSFQALADRGLINYRNAQQIANSYRAVDRMMAEPNQILTQGATQNVNLAFLARKAANIVGAMVGRHMNTGTIQIPGIGSQIAGNMLDQFFSNLTGQQARNIQFDMLVNPKLFEAVVNPAGATEQAQVASLHHTLAPYIAAAPTAIAAQLSKQPGPQTQSGAGQQFLPH